MVEVHWKRDGVLRVKERVWGYDLNQNRADWVEIETKITDPAEIRAFFARSG